MLKLSPFLRTLTQTFSPFGGALDRGLAGIQYR